MDPIIPSIQMPQLGDEVVLSDKVRSWINPEIKNAIKNGGRLTIQMISLAAAFSTFKLYSFIIECHGQWQELIIKENGTPAWNAEFYSNWPVLYWPSSEIHSATEPSYNLKELNTKLEAIVCAKCGAKLKDPGLGPIYKHCPTCEP